MNIAAEGMDQFRAIKVTFAGRIALVEIDNPPVNAISQAVRQDLKTFFDRVEGTGPLEWIVLAGAGGRFPAGADIREFGNPPRPPSLSDVISGMEACRTPIAAFIQSAALGGGFELALSCDLRICDENAVVGLPEVKLGIIPGAGGTQRILRLVGAADAVRLVAGGNPVKSRKALAAGLVDHVVRLQSVQEICDFLQDIRPVRRRLSALPVLSEADEEFEQAAREVTRKAKGAIAASRAVDVIRFGLQADFNSGLSREKEAFLELRQSEQAAALRHLFFAEKEASKVPGLAAEPAPLTTVSVIGAGTMGRGIAMALANAGCEVFLSDTTEAAVTAALSNIAGAYERSAQSGRMSAEEASQRCGRIQGDVDLQSVSSVDLCIEAVFEDMDVKRALFARLGALAKPDSILATNTSFLDVNEIASASGRPEGVVGLHFFSPAHVMPLLEIVRGDRTSPQVLASAVDLAKRMRKIAVIAGVCDGFIGNRISQAYRQQCEYMLEEGAFPEDIDRALTGFGFAMGTFAVADMAGLDISAARRKRLAPFRDPAIRYVALADRLHEMGRNGQKTGAGWYRYTAAAPKGEPDPEVAALIVQHSAARNIVRRPIPADEIERRAVFAMVNEALHVLDEGIAQRASDIDVVMVNGFGFPREKGGPLFWASRRTASEIEAALAELARAGGPGFKVAPDAISRLRFLAS